jgi:hypothetical protein
MDTHPDDLSDLERRLAGCAPASAGLDVDAMLFDAGRASARPGAVRFLWPGLAACLAALATALGVWLAAERAERLALAERLRQPSPVAPPPSPAPSEPPTADEPRPDSVLAARRALERGLDAWPPAPVPRDDSPGPPPPDSPVLRVGRSANPPDL